MKHGIMLVCPECEAVQSTQHDFCVNCGASLESARLVQPVVSDANAKGGSKGTSQAEPVSTKSAPRKQAPALAVGASVGLLLAVVAVLTRLGDYPLPELLVAAAIAWVVWSLLIAGAIGLARTKHPGKIIAAIAAALIVCVGAPILILVLPGYYNTTPTAPEPMSTTAFTAPTRDVRIPTRTTPETWVSAQGLLATSRALLSTAGGVSRPSAPATAPPKKATAMPPPLATNTPSYDPESVPEWRKQTLTAIGNQLSTAAAQATVEERQLRKTPTPMACLSGVSISAPSHGSTVRGSVDVHGTASIPGFQYYKLEYSTLPQPSSGDWTTIGELHGQPASNSKLAVWESSALPSGWYWLRLVVVDQTGNFPEPCAIRVRVTE